jgi:hypothetical protein
MNNVFAVIGQPVPVKRPWDHSTKAESAANALRNRWRVGPGWQHARAPTVLVRLDHFACTGQHATHVHQQVSYGIHVGKIVESTAYGKFA